MSICGSGVSGQARERSASTTRVRTAFGPKQTFAFIASKSAFDPERTFKARPVLPRSTRQGAWR
jgi:hypothetical protein